MSKIFAKIAFYQRLRGFYYFVFYPFSRPCSRVLQFNKIHITVIKKGLPVHREAFCIVC